jgi:multicomponent Na+:H+ antiporter subunit D
MTPQALMAAILLLPVLVAVGVVLTGRHPNLRETVTVAGGLVLFGLAVLLTTQVYGAAPVTLVLAEPVAGLSLQLTPEPLGLLFALIAGLLWPVTSVYSVGYMRTNREGNQTRFYAAFAISIGAAMGIALAGNLFTLFVFYEVLSVATYPLVTHAGTDKARKAGRLYLGVLMGTSIGFFLLAMVWTWQLTGTLEFTTGGIFDDTVDEGILSLLLMLFVFGTAKAALMPFHRWLPAAMVAPTPVSALLHAVAVVKAGVFTVVKVSVYIFGIDTLARIAAADWLLVMASFTILSASVVALYNDNLKARLAYSTISQLSYVILGCALATSMGVMGGSIQIAMHAMGKITLFFCAGAIYTATHKTEISQMDGLGRVMPITYAAFLIGALSVVGLPPLGGSWSKWFLLVGAADAQQMAAIAVLLVSSLLNVAYLLPVAARGFFRGAPENRTTGRIAIAEAPAFCVIPLSLTAAGCVLLFFFADALFAFLIPITSPVTTP